MPLIQSKKYPNPNHEHYVTPDEWKEMQDSDNGVVRRFRVIDDGDIQQTVIKTPIDIGFISKEGISFDVEKTVEDIRPSREEMKAALNKAGVEYNKRTSTDKLYEEYLINLF